MTRNEAYFDRFTISLYSDDAESASHAGQCDDDVAYLLTLDYVKAQIVNIGPNKIRDELREYGAWDESELRDDEANKSRIVWIAAGNIKEESPE